MTHSLPSQVQTSGIGGAFSIGDVIDGKEAVKQRIVIHLQLKMQRWFKLRLLRLISIHGEPDYRRTFGAFAGTPFFGQFQRETPSCREGLRS